MPREHILAEIRRTASASGGVARVDAPALVLAVRRLIRPAGVAESTVYGCLVP
jgi:hypothetical protein